MTTALRVPVLLALLLSVAALAPLTGTAADSNLVVGGAWIRQPPPGSDVAAVYLSLLNAGTHTVRLTGVESPVAAMAMMHETLESAGQSQMRMLTSVSVAPGKSIAFTPGGRHIMLQGADPSTAGGRTRPDRAAVCRWHQAARHHRRSTLKFGLSAPTQRH